MEKEVYLLNKEAKIQDEEIYQLIKKYNITELDYFNLLREFYNERNKVVLSSRIEANKEKEIYNKKMSTPSDKIYSEIISERDLDEDVDTYLIRNNMQPCEKGARYLGELIKLLYHERELYNKIDNDEFNYFNLDDYSNIHYKYIDKVPEIVISEIIKTIVNSSEEQIRISINDIVYNGVNEIYNYKSENRHLKKYIKKI